MKTAELGTRLSGISESVTLKLNAMVQRLRAEGQDVINLTAGEPDFAAPEASKKAIIKALEENQSKYTPAAGIGELRKLVAEKTNAQQPAVARTAPWEASSVVITNGGKQALFNTFMAILDPGDEVLIPSPYWLSYPDMVRIAGGVPRFVRGSFESGFLVAAEQIRQAITPRTRMILFNSPNNPTGRMYSAGEFRRIGEVLGEFPRIWVVSDEIYDRITFGEVEFCSFLEAAPLLRERCVTINGMSKSASMTGWRVGWSVARKDLTDAMIKLQGQSTSGINSLAQWASIAALRIPEAEFAYQVESFRKRRDLVLEILSKSGKIKVCRPQGAFYVFVGVEGFLREKESAVQFAERLLQETNVAVVPGDPFGESQFIRISFATDEASLREGCERILRFLSE